MRLQYRIAQHKWNYSCCNVSPPRCTYTLCVYWSLSHRSCTRMFFVVHNNSYHNVWCARTDSFQFLLYRFIFLSHLCPLLCSLFVGKTYINFSCITNFLSLAFVLFFSILINFHRIKLWFVRRVCFCIFERILLRLDCDFRSSYRFSSFNVQKTNQQNSKTLKNKIKQHDFDQFQRWIGWKYQKLEQVS